MSQCNDIIWHSWSYVLQGQKPALSGEAPSHQQTNHDMLVVYKTALLANSKITFTWELPLEASFTTTSLLMGHVPSIYWMKDEAFCLKTPYDLCFLLLSHNQHQLFFLVLLVLLMLVHLHESFMFCMKMWIFSTSKLECKQFCMRVSLRALP